LLSIHVKDATTNKGTLCHKIYKNFNDKSSIIKNINLIQLENLLETLEGGMKKKAYAALEALKLGVKKVIVCSGLVEAPIFGALENNEGTVISNDWWCKGFFKEMFRVL